MLISADDQLVPGCLQRATTVMEASPNVGMVYGWALYAHVGRPVPGRYGHWISTKTWSGADWIRLRCQTGFNCISSPEVVVRTTVQTAAGHYDAACTHSSDLNMWLRIAAIANVAHIRGVAQAIYRVHSDSMSRSDPSLVLSLRERRIAFHSAFARVAGTLKDGPVLQRMSDRALARQALWRASRTIDRNLTEAPDPVDDLVGFALEAYPRTTGNCPSGTASPSAGASGPAGRAGSSRSLPRASPTAFTATSPRSSCAPWGCE